MKTFWQIKTVTLYYSRSGAPHLLVGNLVGQVFRDGLSVSVAEQEPCNQNKNDHYKVTSNESHGDNSVVR